MYECVVGGGNFTPLLNQRKHLCGQSWRGNDCSILTHIPNRNKPGFCSFCHLSYNEEPLRTLTAHLLLSRSGAIHERTTMCRSRLRWGEKNKKSGSPNKGVIVRGLTCLSDILIGACLYKCNVHPRMTNEALFCHRLAEHAGQTSWNKDINKIDLKHRVTPRPQSAKPLTTHFKACHKGFHEDIDGRCLWRGGHGLSDHLVEEALVPDISWGPLRRTRTHVDVALFSVHGDDLLYTYQKP